MMPWIISYDMMHAIEDQTERQARYAPHRAHMYRRPGRFLASVFSRWTLPRPRRSYSPSIVDPAEVRTTITVVPVRD